MEKYRIGFSQLINGSKIAQQEFNELHVILLSQMNYQESRSNKYESFNEGHIL